jgi:hypothetical protein
MLIPSKENYTIALERLRFIPFKGNYAITLVGETRILCIIRAL